MDFSKFIVHNIIAWFTAMMFLTGAGALEISSNEEINQPDYPPRISFKVLFPDADDMPNQRKT